MGLVIPAVLPSSKKDLEDTLAILTNLPNVSHIQIDVVDGHFASPASWPFTAQSELTDMARSEKMLPFSDRLTYELDLMCLHADKAAEAWVSLGATRLLFHAESTPDLPKLIRSAKERYAGGAGFSSDIMSFGVAINVGSDLALIEQVYDEIDYVQCMGIERIGRQGQPLDSQVFEKIRVLHERHPSLTLQVDGGVTLENARRLRALGVSNLVVGSAILRAKDPVAAFASFQKENPE